MNTYTERQLVEFGNYLLSRKRHDSIMYGKQIDELEAYELCDVVHQEDIDNAFPDVLDSTN